MHARGASAARILVILALAAAATGGATPAAQPDGRVIEVVARRFAFEPQEIEVTVGERVILAVRSADGVHGLEIGKLDVKQVIPRGGAAVRIQFVAPAPGRYPIVCSEYCGNGHEDMKGLLVVRADAGGDSR
jgi:cytochrome c oxidase subunit 2